MAREPLSRSNGIALGRLPNYSAAYINVDENDQRLQRLCSEMRALVIEKARLRLNGKQSSDRTIEVASDVMNEVCGRIWRLGFKPESPAQFNGKHIEAVIRDYWACGVSPKHFASIYTTLRKFDDWIGKPGLIKDKHIYLPEVHRHEFMASQVAKKSKSWQGNGIDLEQKLKEADALDVRFGLMLRMCAAFGLRRIEVLQIKPWLDDKGYCLEIRPGVAKGGRPRLIPIEFDLQRDVLDLAKKRIKQNEHIGWPDDKHQSAKPLLERNKSRYMYLLRCIGLTKSMSGSTGHGLRAQFAEQLALSKGYLPATLGGVKNQIPKEDEELIRLQIAENLGHSRKTITSSYYGSTTKKIQNSQGVKIATIYVSQHAIASVFANPPPIKNAEGHYPKLRARSITGTDLTLVIEDVADGMSTGTENSFQILLNDGDAKILPIPTLKNYFEEIPDIDAKIRLVMTNFGYL